MTKIIGQLQAGSAIFILLLVLSACSGGSGTSESIPTDTGDVIIHVSMESDGTKSGGFQAAQVDCAATGIATIEADVFDVSDNLLATGGPWPCTDHGGTITGVSAGINRKIIALARDSGSTVLFSGENTGINVVAGVPNDGGTIVLSVPVSGVTITESDGSTNVSEDGVTDSYNVVLGSQPTATVSIEANPDGQTDLGAGTGNPITLNFTTVNWNSPQTVMVTAVDDAVVEGAHTSTISHSATSTDSNYNGITIANVTVNITDNDPVAPVTLIWDSGNWDEANWE
jgi:hypothetical protein